MEGVATKPSSALFGRNVSANCSFELAKLYRSAVAITIANANAAQSYE